MALGDKIRQLRESKGYTLLTLANMIGVKEATIQRYESGNIKNPGQEKLVALANALDVDVNELLDYKDTKSPRKWRLDEDEEELIMIFRRLGRRERHEMMAKAYELEKSSNQ